MVPTGKSALRYCFLCLLTLCFLLMAKPDFDVLPKAMAAWRHERGMTQREVAKAANTTASTIARIELDDLNPSWFTFIAICNALAVNPEWVAQIRRWPENAKAVA